MSLKLACLRLGKTSVVISRSSSKISLALISEKFIKDADARYFVAPFVAFEQRAADVLVPLTENSSQVMEVITSYCSPLFTSKSQLKRYVLQHLQQDGTEIFVTHLRNPNHPEKINNELCNDGGDIIVRAEALQELGLPSSPNLFENSLAHAVDWMYIQHPPHFQLEVNGKLHHSQNPCHRIVQEQGHEAFSQGQSQGFRWRLANEPH